MSATPFEPARYLTRVSGSDYLEVKWRLVWMREKHPDARITTELLADDFDPGKPHSRAVVRAHIVIPGGGEATGIGSETAGDFRDYMEKAETKAIGRALAALGFGTQFAPDHDFGVAQGRAVDSPVSRGNGPQDAKTSPSRGETPTPIHQGTRKDPPASEAQIRGLHGIGRQCDPPLNHEDLKVQAWARFKVPHLHQLTTREANTLREYLVKNDLVEPDEPMPREDPIEANEQFPDPTRV